MHHSRVLACSLAALAITSCGGLTKALDGGSSGCSTEFCDKLAFGTGIGGNGFQLVGENTSFSLATTHGDITFRFESAEDSAGRAVRLYIYSGGGSSASPYWQKDYPVLQSYGHIYLSTFRITDPGSYEIRAYYVKDVGGGIGQETKVITAPITITQ